VGGACWRPIDEGASGTRLQGVVVAAQDIRPVTALDSGSSDALVGPSRSDRSPDAQQRVNDQLWAGKRLVGAYANRELRPVEVVILVRYRDALSGHVLELGSGAGRLTGYLAAIADSVVGIDLSPDMVEYSRRHYPGVDFRQGDIRDQSVFDAAPYDAIVAPYNIVDVLDDGDRQILLDRVCAALRPGGLFVMSSHNREVAGSLGDPLRLVGQSPTQAFLTVARWPRWWLNRRRLRAFERNEPSYAILNDVIHDYAGLHYYVTREAQEQQLARHGFELRECLDLHGATIEPGDPAAHSSELHYVAQRAG
jgi:SAM-dependent methyltransferase